MNKQLRQNDISELPRLDRERYENIFNVYDINLGDEDRYFFYNILKKISLEDDNIDPNAFEYIRVDKKIPWTTISHDIYGTQHLWWLILAANKISNPIILPVVGDVLRIVKAEYVDVVVDQIAAR
jgi:hypothetical protein